MRCFHAVGQYVLATPSVLRYCVRITRVTNGNAERNKLKIAGHTHRKRNKRIGELPNKQHDQTDRRSDAYWRGNLFYACSATVLPHTALPTYAAVSVKRWLADIIICSCGTFYSRARENPTPTKLNRTKTIIVKIIIIQICTACLKSDVTRGYHRSERWK